jgi:GntR family transcriptional repressor for pyruvate dehydrogenase complex
MGSKSSVQIKFKRAPKLSEQVADYLIMEIKRGSFKPGDNLPSEAILAKQLNVSRTVIREAFARLKYDGLLDSKQGSGAKVTKRYKMRAFRLDGVEQANTEEVRHLFELRIIVEGGAAAFAAKRRSDKDLEKLERYLKDMENAVRNGADGITPDVKFHQTIAEASGNPYLRDFMCFLNDKLVYLIRGAREHSSHHLGLPIVAQQEHLAIFEAILDKNSTKARNASLAHLKNAAERLNLIVHYPS